ncbi:hypothetical protein BU16DRAFT_119461 [Lophium mytilinum]|uniref:Uncharacterized protein n=1 Tax=Lophium mytilinum TaxID=390894 RepID=A0A6A6QGY7_9PEZI|nr:hypothetical protein BU16DRAFT_119461 [Lophium mytilinum]
MPLVYIRYILNLRPTFAPTAALLRSFFRCCRSDMSRLFDLVSPFEEAVEGFAVLRVHLTAVFALWFHGGLSAAFCFCGAVRISPAVRIFSTIRILVRILRALNSAVWGRSPAASRSWRR